MYKSLWIFLCVCILQGYTISTVAQGVKSKAAIAEKKSVTSTETLNPNTTAPVNTSSSTETLAINNYLTDEQAHLLSTYLDTSSNTQLLFSLMQAIADSQKEVRDAALEAIRKILADNPSWANSNSLTLIPELFSKKGKELELTSIFQLLNTFLQANTEVSKEILELAFAIIKSNTTVDHPASQSIAILFRNLATISPDLVKDIIVMAQADADDRNRDEQVRVEILRILNSIADIENVKSDLSNMDKLFSIVLQDAQDTSTYVTNEVVSVLTTINKTNPEYVQKAFLAILRSTKSDDYGTRSSGLSTLRFFLRAEPTYAEQVFQVAITAMKDKQPLVRWNALAALATVVKSDPKYTQGALEVTLKAANEADTSVSTMALRLLTVLIKLDDQYPAQTLDTATQATESKSPEIVIEALKLVATIADSDANCAPTAFEVGNKAIQQPDEQVRWNGLLVLLSVVKVANTAYAQKVFDIAVKATTDKFEFIRQDALAVIQTIVENNPQYATKAMPIAAKLTQDEQDNVRIAAISVLESSLKVNPQLIESTYKTAVTIVKDKSTEVRRQVWDLLETILKTDVKYVQQKEFRSMIREASLDADATIRKITHNLLVTYLLKE